jgi:hypothetical protein
MFGLMVPVREKQAMDFVSDETGMPLSRIFYDSIHRSVETALGRVLIEGVDRGRPSDGMPILPIDEIAAVPQLFRDFGRLIEIHMDSFSAIFPKFNFTFDSTFVTDLDVANIALSIGRDYLESGRPFKPMPVEEVRAHLFRTLLYEFYRTSAIGPIVDLEDAWKARKAEIGHITAEILSDYMEMYAEVVEVEEVVEVPGGEPIDAEPIKDEDVSKDKKKKK